MIYIEQTIDEVSRETEVEITLSRADAVALFHAINRTLAVVDDEVPELPDHRDQAAYDAADAFVNQLQQKLNIEPDPAR
jgi:hypothetical protein